MQKSKNLMTLRKGIELICDDFQSIDCENPAIYGIVLFIEANL